jgi:hypothetical protein
MRNFHSSNVGTAAEKYRSRMRAKRVTALEAQILSINGSSKSIGPLGQLTGCASELSYRAQDYDKYCSTFKSFGEVYRQCHANLAADDALLQHDYTLTVAATEEHASLGLLGDEIEQLVRSHVHFSDEEIEQFGYLGWLQH